MKQAEASQYGPLTEAILPLSSRARSLSYLYISHFLTRWGSRMWEFGVGLFMLNIWQNSLLLTSAYGLVEDLAVVSLGVAIGNWVDRTPRLKVVQISMGTRNGSILGAAIALIILLLHHDWTSGWSTALYIGLIGLVNLLGGLSALSGLATNIAIERDWVLAIADGQRLATLTELNAAMRGIDLTCKLLAPVLVGMIMSYVSVAAAAILLCVWNVISIGFEYFLLRCLYNACPELQRERIILADVDEPQGHVQSIVDEGLSPPVLTLESSSCYQQNAKEPTSDSCQGSGPYQTSLLSRRPGDSLRQWASKMYQHALHLSFVEALRVYLAQEMVLAAVSLALLYFTVLSFGSLMTAALSWRGISSSILGLVRGVSALVGICGTLAYPKVRGRIHTVRTGLHSIIMQWAFLSLCVASNWISSLIASSALLMGGVVLSRFGLWMFDLAVLQLMQESTPENERGVVGGVQNSIQSFLEMLSFLAGMLISNPKDFDKLVYMSYGSVTCALILYCIQSYRARGHLLHFHRALRSR